jgi:hypothetical protein
LSPAGSPARRYADYAAASLLNIASAYGQSSNDAEENEVGPRRRAGLARVRIVIESPDVVPYLAALSMETIGGHVPAWAWPVTTNPWRS